MATPSSAAWQQAPAGWTRKPGGVYNTVVRLANWCTPEPAFPVTLELRLGPEELTVTGGSFPEGDSMPPCLRRRHPDLRGGTLTEVP